jgi:hypothetical protein
MISFYSEKTKFPVYDVNVWDGDNWDALDY